MTPRTPLDVGRPMKLSRTLFSPSRHRLWVPLNVGRPIKPFLAGPLRFNRPISYNGKPLATTIP